MRHLKKGRKLGRERDQRKALIAALIYSFFIKERIKTTEAKAKEMRPVVEKMITRAKNPTLANRRILLKNFQPALVNKIIQKAEKLKTRTGGYTRIIRLGRRKSDGAKMALIEFVE